MKKLLCLLFMLPLLAHGEVTLDQIWDVGSLRTPESVLYYNDGDEAYLLVSEIEGEGADADEDGGIAKLSLEGEILNQDWIRGLNAPKGMGAHQGKLYVADIDEVVVIDIASREVESRIPIEGSMFLNDIAVDNEGVVYVSDTHTHKVHRIKNGHSDEFLSDVTRANGLTVVNSKLYVAAGAFLWKADTESGELTKVTEGFAEQADGVEMIGDDEFIVSCWAGLVYHVDAEGKITTLIDSREPRVNTADLGWNPKQEIIYIPTFFNNTVVAYQVE